MLLLLGVWIFTTLVRQLSDGVLWKVWHCLEESVDGADTNDELEEESQSPTGGNLDPVWFSGF